MPAVVEASKVWIAQEKELESLRDLGCKGTSPFAALPGYNQETFFHYPVAHALLYGVLRDFWRLVLRKPSDELKHGHDIIVDSSARAEMRRLFGTLRVTSSFSSAPKDITKCVLAAELRVVVTTLMHQTGAV